MQGKLPHHNNIKLKSDLGLYVLTEVDLIRALISRDPPICSFF